MLRNRNVYGITKAVANVYVLCPRKFETKSEAILYHRKAFTKCFLRTVDTFSESFNRELASFHVATADVLFFN